MRNKSLVFPLIGIFLSSSELHLWWGQYAAPGNVRISSLLCFVLSPNRFFLSLAFWEGRKGPYLYIWSQPICQLNDHDEKVAVYRGWIKLQVLKSKGMHCCIRPVYTHYTLIYRSKERNIGPKYRYGCWKVEMGCIHLEYNHIYNIWAKIQHVYVIIHLL